MEEDNKKSFEKDIEINSKDAFANGELAFSLYQQGKIKETIQNFKKVIEKNPKYEEAYSNLCLTLYQQGKLK